MFYFMWSCTALSCFIVKSVFCEIKKGLTLTLEALQVSVEQTSTNKQNATVKNINKVGDTSGR